MNGFGSSPRRAGSALRSPPVPPLSVTPSCCCSASGSIGSRLDTHQGLMSRQYSEEKVVLRFSGCVGELLCKLFHLRSLHVFVFLQPFEDISEPGVVTQGF